jgi:prepilin-type N-terminal cleavage/methylation domain-containing protein
MQLKRQQKGFTLVEIAVVLVIIGLLLGGVLKGQELISSARVRNLADQQAGIQAAYYGFQDRYRAVPGDMDSTAAADAIGVAVNQGGNENGRLEAPVAGANAVWDELNAVWEHLAKAGFIKGNYDGGSGGPPVAGNTETSPVNVFSSPLILARHDGFEGTGAARLVLYLGQNVPVDIARELDVKLDDGRPTTGVLRAATESGGPTVFESATGCVDDLTAADPQWDVAEGVTNCNPTYLF